MKKLTTEEFTRRAKEIHGDKYDYSKTDLINRDEKGRVCIICSIHGEFWQTPFNHLNGHGCSFCTNRFGYNTEGFIKEAKMIHGNKYDYSKVIYKNNKTNICIICPKHGEFWQRPDKHLNGQGCSKCATEIIHKKQRLTTKGFIIKSIEIHGEKYDYSKVNYFNSSTKVCIICPIHGEFWQRPTDHLKGCGCWKCRQSILERKILEKLSENNIKYEYNIFPTFLNGLQLDFYLPEYNVAIECQGIQHFIEGHFFESLDVVQERDERKRKLCRENGVKLFYYSDLGIEYPYEVFEDKNKLLDEIKKYGNS